jgi:uncharacterized Zn finger protein (UPF0148 family)
VRLKQPIACACSACGKPFFRLRARGSMEVCSPCQRRARLSAWKKANPERVLATNTKSREANRESDRASKLRWSIANRHLEAAKQSKRRAVKRRAVPLWADADITKSLYHLARIYTDALGNEIHVDHIVPLQSDFVCGLHWHGNLQLLPGLENRMKSNQLLREGNP